MARGRKPKPKKLPKPPVDENAKYRTVVYHLCGREIFSQPIEDRAALGYHFAFFGDRSDPTPLAVCPQCATRVSRQSIRLPAEQYMYELAQESLALQLERQHEEEPDESTDAETNPPE